MTDILTEIIACKQIEIELQKAAISKEMLINNCNEPMPRISMRASLASSPYGIISEFKRRSPSKGWIKRRRTGRYHSSRLRSGRSLRTFHPHR